IIGSRRGSPGSRRRRWHAGRASGGRAGGWTMPEFAIRRVVLGLDAVSELREAVDTAAALAKSWHAELHGLFIRDAGLLRLAELPFVREVTLAAEPRPMSPEGLLA